MANALKSGIILGAGSQLANLVVRSPIGEAVSDGLRTGFGPEHFTNGFTQAGAFAGVALASYGLTKIAIEKGMPIASENTAKAGSLTSALSVAYGLAHTDIFQNTLCNMSSYNHQISNALEVMAMAGIGAGIIATGALFVKDIYEFASSKLKR